MRLTRLDLAASRWVRVVRSAFRASFCRRSPSLHRTLVTRWSATVTASVSVGVGSMLVLARSRKPKAG